VAFVHALPVNVTAVLVDARNVARSRWPNLSDDQLVAAVRRWAERKGVRPVIVFDGQAPERADDVVGTGGAGSADDWIAAAAERLRAEAAPFWLVTSDRGLRARAGPGAERVIGGGAFLGLLGER
jgi:hypothetical protein